MNRVAQVFTQLCAQDPPSERLPLDPIFKFLPRFTLDQPHLLSVPTFGKTFRVTNYFSPRSHAALYILAAPLRHLEIFFCLLGGGLSEG